MASNIEIEIFLKSARDLKNVNWRHGFNKPYAVIWVDPSRKVSSLVAEKDTCPQWYQTLVIPVDGPIEEATVLHIDIKHAEDICKPLIGSVEIPLREVIVGVGIGSRASRELELKRPSGRLQGKLEIDVAVRVQPRLHETEPQDNQTISALSLGGFPAHVQATNQQPINMHFSMNFFVLPPLPSNAPSGQQYNLYGQGQRYAQPVSYPNSGNNTRGAWVASTRSNSTFNRR